MYSPNGTLVPTNSINTKPIGSLRMQFRNVNGEFEIVGRIAFHCSDSEKLNPARDSARWSIAIFVHLRNAITSLESLLRASIFGRVNIQSNPLNAPSVFNHENEDIKQIQLQKRFANSIPWTKFMLSFPERYLTQWRWKISRLISLLIFSDYNNLDTIVILYSESFYMLDEF